MSNAIEIKNLKKKYDNNFELGEINLEIPSGYIIGLIGENGAGKTTLIKSILNIIKPEYGEIKIFDKNNKKYESIIKEDDTNKIFCFSTNKFTSLIQVKKYYKNVANE